MRKGLLAGALVATVFVATAAWAARQDFTVTNSTGYVIVSLNVAPSSSDQWGPDILGRDVLADGEQVEVTFDRDETECLWDIRATYQDGTENDERQVDLCEVAEVEFVA